MKIKVKAVNRKSSSFKVQVGVELDQAITAAVSSINDSNYRWDGFKFRYRRINKGKRQIDEDPS